MNVGSREHHQRNTAVLLHVLDFTLLLILLQSML